MAGDIDIIIDVDDNQPERLVCPKCRTVHDVPIRDIRTGYKFKCRGCGEEIELDVDVGP